MENNLQIYKASAGSGKTFTLAVEYISLLAINPKEYQHILAVTFTNKATAEMKQRILGTLYGISHRLTSADAYIDNILSKVNTLKEQPQYQTSDYIQHLKNFDREKLIANCAEALSCIIHDYSRFRIETIDSFFKGIVQEIANELELATNLKVELDTKVALSDAVDDILDNLNTSSAEFATITNLIDTQITKDNSGSWDVSTTIKSFGENIFKENYLIHGDKVLNTITNNVVINTYEKNLYAHLRNKKNQLVSDAQYFNATYTNAIYNKKFCNTTIVTFFEKVANMNDFEVPNLTSTVRSHTELKKWFKSNVNVPQNIKDTVDKNLIPFFENFIKKYDEYISVKANIDAIKVHLQHLLLLKTISEKVKELNTKNNTFLLSETSNFLRNVINNSNIPFIYEKTGTVIRHIMIDEFQDTSTLQWGNFKPLILNCLSNSDSCLIVGDVKQSIYRFRNSDWQILNDIENDPELKNYIEPISAKYNYRSSKRIVEFNNAFFTKMTDTLTSEESDKVDFDTSILKTAYSDVQQKPVKSKDSGYIRIENIDYHNLLSELQSEEENGEKDDVSTSLDLNEAYLQRIQLAAKDLIDNGVNQNDITILIRNNNEVPLICDYFSNHQNVLQANVVSDAAFRLDASPTINIIIYALRSLASQNNQLPLASLAYHYQTLVCGNEDIKSNLSIAFLSEDTDALNKLLPEQFQSGNRAKYQFKSLVELIEDIYQIFELNKISHQDAYLFCFYDAVQEYSNDNLTDLDSFLSAWDETIGKKTIPNGAADGIRIMTMHKSKGLEFHSVILPYCNWSITPKPSDLMWCQPGESPYNGLPLLPIEAHSATSDTIFYDDFKNESLKTLVDNINVLYVAFTRPKNNLIIITGNKSDKKEKKSKNGNKLNDVQHLIMDCLPDGMAHEDFEGIVDIHTIGDIVPSETKDEKDDNILTQKPLPLNVKYVSHPSIAVFRQSNESELFINGDSDNADSQARAHKVSLIATGNLYHNIFQNITTPDTLHRAVMRMKSTGCFENIVDTERAEKQIATLINNRHTDHPEWFSADWKVINERAIVYRDKEGNVVNKRPDRVIVNGDKAIVIDYKTATGIVSKAQEGNGPAMRTLKENIAQVKQYVRLLKQLGFSDIKAYLWYILDNDTIYEVK